MCPNIGSVGSRQLQGLGLPLATPPPILSGGRCPPTILTIATPFPETQSISRPPVIVSERIQRTSQRCRSNSPHVKTRTLQTEQLSSISLLSLVPHPALPASINCATFCQNRRNSSSVQTERTFASERVDPGNSLDPACCCLRWRLILRMASLSTILIQNCQYPRSSAFISLRTTAGWKSFDKGTPCASDSRDGVMWVVNL